MSARPAGAGASAAVPDATAPAAIPSAAVPDATAPATVAPRAPEDTAPGVPGEDALAIRGPLGPALVKVIRGNPSPDEIAAATAVLVALARRGAPAGEGANAVPPRRQPAPAAGGSRHPWRAPRQTPE
ncbi:acyl-CoA carboxylase epsilon subunit [Streptomyces sp. NPDC018031]|uniref:acyl-CoA carboxylase epsilon subunit n=1 Tax=Streptomyces sp. NPDC018031 TaxID=3365033 RepID=UPI0037A05FBD